MMRTMTRNRLEMQHLVLDLMEKGERQKFDCSFQACRYCSNVKLPSLGILDLNATQLVPDMLSELKRHDKLANRIRHS